jgi:hypothetical protein
MMKHRASGVRAVVISLLLLAFVTGASAGVAGDRLLTPQLRLRIVAPDMSTVFDRLRLSPEQRRQAESIAARSAPRSHAIMLETAERLRAVADSVDTELRAILTPDQRRTLDSLRVGPRLMLRRKVVGAGGTTIDTLFDTSIKTPSKR